MLVKSMREIIKSWGFKRYEYFGWGLEENCGEKQLRVYFASDAPVAQLDRALPSGGRSQRFESSRARQLSFLKISQLHHSEPRQVLF